MPSRGATICVCGAVVPAGATCPCRATQAKASRATYDEHRGSSTERGYDWTWRKLRAAHLSESPLCVECLEYEVVEIAVDVDHIVPIWKAPKRRLDATNLRSLCRHHHNIKTRAEAAERNAPPGWPQTLGKGVETDRG